MKSRLILFVFAFFVWALLNWVPDWQHLFVGVFVASLVAYITGDLFVQSPYKLKRIDRYLWFLYYIPVFLWEMLKANIDVAYRVIHPKLPIKPGIVKVKTTLKSETGLTFLANSITLTPGTLSVDIDEGKGYLYIHCIDVRHEDIEGATKNISAKFEKILMRIFE